MKRLYFLDNVRIFLSVLVVLHHVGTGYGTMGGWCYITPEKMTGPVQIIFSALFGIEALFSMSLFFFISAFLTTHSLEKKGASAFIKTQLLRLFVPLLFVMVFLAPGILFLIEKYNNTIQLSWFEYIWQQNINAPNTSHTWFILVLIVFEMAYVLYWKFIRPVFPVSKNISNAVPSHLSIAIFVLLCSFLSVMVRIVYPIGKNFIGLQFANFVPYILMYALGIMVYRKNWLLLLSKKVAQTWFILSLLLSVWFCFLVYQVIQNPPLINNYITGLHWQSISLAIIESVVCIGFCGFLLQFFNKKFDYSNALLLKMTENRYGVYIFHSGIVVGVTIMLEFIPLPPYVKFMLACVLSVLFSYVFVGLLRNIKFIRRII